MAWILQLLALSTCFLLSAVGRAAGLSSDLTTITNYLANTYSEIRGTSNAHVRVLTADEAVASVDKVFAKAPMHKFASDQLARMKRLLKENLAFVYSYDATVVEEPLAYRVNGKDAKLPVGSTFSSYSYRERFSSSLSLTASRKSSTPSAMRSSSSATTTPPSP